MAKFYKVIKDHPMWEVGAILSNKGEATKYFPVDAIWVKDIKGVTEEWYEGAKLVENQSEWFARVYPVSTLTKTSYLARDAAKAQLEKLYK